jgi:hypothetical protein
MKGVGTEEPKFEILFIPTVMLLNVLISYDVTLCPCVCSAVIFSGQNAFIPHFDYNTLNRIGNKL